MHCASASTSRYFNRAVAISQLNLALCIWPEANLLPVDVFESENSKYTEMRFRFSAGAPLRSPLVELTALTSRPSWVKGRGNRREGGMGEADGSRPGEDKAERN